MTDVVIIPAYQPDKALVNLVNEINESGFGIIVVDDGSGKDYKNIFEQIEDKSHVITLEKNAGKGAALKSGFAAVKSVFPDCRHIITSDADGQHKIEDIIRVKEELANQSEMVLTIRKRKGKIPFRSKIGNDLSKFVYTILTGHYFFDNQSGLRGFSAKHIDWLCMVKGEKYDYELNVIYYADKQAVPITTIAIEAVYIDDNKSSHFEPLKDTLRIYKLLFSSAWVSFVSALLCEILIVLSGIFFGNRLIYLTVPSAGVIAAFFSVIINRFIAFRNFKYGDGTRAVIFTIIRFVAYTLMCMLISLILPRIPLFVSFNIVVIILTPLRYYAHKAVHLARYRDINKE